MKIKRQRVFSDTGKHIIELVEIDDGLYMLEKYVIKYDSEEELFYEVKELPNPPGIYGDFNTALNEAKRLLGVC